MEEANNSNEHRGTSPKDVNPFHHLVFDETIGQWSLESGVVMCFWFSSAPSPLGQGCETKRAFCVMQAEHLTASVGQLRMPRCVHFWMVMVALAFSAEAHARTLVVGKGQEFEQPSAAATSATDGDRVTIQPGEYFDCAVWKANGLVVEGLGDPAAVVITDKSCQGKALFVTQGDHITIRNLTLTRARVPDGNGAGIRAEGQDLLVEGVRFINNQNGILSGAQGGSMIVRESLFERNGTCEAACAHGLYVNQLDFLKVERSRFVGTKQGHHIKSRARRAEVTDAVIEDGTEGTASYAIEVPNGGTLIVRGTSIQKGPNAENHSAAIVIGAEGVTQRTEEITIEDNTFRNDGPWETVFVNNLTATPAVLRDNRLVGLVKPLRGDGQVFARR